MRLYIQEERNEKEKAKGIRSNLKAALSFINSDSMLLDLSKIQRITNKTLFQENLKSSLDTYISEFYDNFIDKYLNPIVKDYTDNGNFIEKKLIDSSLEFYGQKTQMEYLLNGGENDVTDRV